MSLADQVAKDRGQPSNVRIGVVSSESPLLVNVQDTLFSNVGVVGGYVPAAGDVVALLGQSAVSADGSSWLLLGRVVPSVLAPVVNEDGIHVTGPGGGQVQGGGFANMTGVSMLFTKRSSTSRLYVQMIGSAYSQAVNNGGLWGVTFDGGTVHVLAKKFFNPILTHGSYGGGDYISGLAAGTSTVRGVYGRYIGASNIVWDDNDDLSLMIREVA